MDTLSILERLNGNAKTSFQRDLKLVETLVETKEYKSMKYHTQINKSEVCFKDVFDSLENSYDYDLYKYRILNNNIYDRYLHNHSILYKWNEKTKDSYNLINIFNTYCGFIAEIILTDIIKDIEGVKKINRSNHLDKKRKTDILINRKIYCQIKNISFLEDSHNNSRIEEYRDFGYLKFIFYKVSDNGIISVMGINGEALPPISSLDGFSSIGAKATTIEELKKSIKKMIS